MRDFCCFAHPPRRSGGGPLRGVHARRLLVELDGVSWTEVFVHSVDFTNFDYCGV